MTETTRKLASIKIVTALDPIPDADLIEVATVDHGWKVVVKKGQVKVGEKVIYFEVDSWVPHRLAPFLSKDHAPRVFNGVEGERLKTVKLRGQISQGLILRIDETAWEIAQDSELEVGADVTELLGVQKYEPPIPAQLAGNVEGKFPSFVFKTDQERCQNLYTEIFVDHASELYEITEKLEGSSMTVYYKNGEFGVCSRNWNLKEEGGSTFWAVAKALQLEEKLSRFDKNIALQGELIGPGVQKNYYNLSTHEFRVFDVFDIDNLEYFRPDARHKIVAELGLSHVPVLALSSSLPAQGMDELLEFAHGKSIVAPGKLREGVVFKSIMSAFHFKVVDNKYLLKIKPDDDE